MLEDAWTVFGGKDRRAATGLARLAPHQESAGKHPMFDTPHFSGLMPLRIIIRHTS